MVHFKDKDPETRFPIKEFPLKAESSGQSYLQQISPYVHVKSDREKGSLYKKVELFWPHQLLKVFINDVILNSPFLISYVCLYMKVKSDHRSKFSNLSSWKKKPEKLRASTGFEPMTSAIPV